MNNPRGLEGEAAAFAAPVLEASADPVTRFVDGMNQRGGDDYVYSREMLDAAVRRGAVSPAPGMLAVGGVASVLR